MLVDDERAMEVRTKHAVATQTTTQQTMTNDNIRTKANAVFFAAIMVVSMVAVGFAAAPAAAVADGDIDGSINSNTTVTQGATVTHDYTVTIEDNVSSPENTSVAFGLGPATPTGDGVTVDSGNAEPTADGFNLNSSADFSSSPVEVTGTVTLDWSGASVGGVTPTATVTDSNDSSDGTTDLTEITVEAPPVEVENRDVASAAQADQIDGVSEGDVLVTSGNTVYQGEEGITFIDADTNEVFSASELSGTSGNREGTPLQMPIPDNEDTGTYDTNGPSDNAADFTTTVVEPRITTAEVRLGDDDIEQIASSRATPTNGLNIFTEYNFEDAEAVEVTVEDPSGADITGEVLETGQDALLETSGERVGLDLSTEDAGEYTVIFEGTDDLDQDSVVQEYTITTTSQDSVQLEIGEDPVTQGSNVDYTVSGATNGDLHTVAIDAGDFREDISVDAADDIFRNVDDVENTGVVDSNGDVIDPDDASANVEFDYAFATVEIDGTTAVGSINTGALDDSTVDVDVYEANNADQPDVSASADDVSFDVEEGEITLDSPTDTYTIGSDVDINGTAASADEVAIYARDNNDWEMLDIDNDGDIDDDDFISVDSDDSFEEEDVNLREASPNILGFEGNYGIGAVDTADLSDDAEEYDTLTNSDFSTASSTRATLTAQSGDLTATFETINGQIADGVDEDIDVSGTASGQNSVVIAFVGNRGDTFATEISVDDDDTFEEDDISLADISQGATTGHVISAGRDGQFGDGGDGNWNDADAVVETINDGFGSSTGDQIRSQILANTVDETASDDLIVSTSFRINDPTLSINNVYPEAAEASGLNPVATGETVVVEGDTNRQPDNAAITVELLTQDENSVQSVSVDEWENDGQWSVTMDTSDVETGTYIIEADDGESTDRVNVEIVEERQTDDGDDGGADGDDGGADGDDGGADGDDGSTDGDDGGADGDDGSMDGDDGGSDGDDGGSDGGDGGTDDSTPGFGALVALVALIAAALLATRRND